MDSVYPPLIEKEMKYRATVCMNELKQFYGDLIMAEVTNITIVDGLEIPDAERESKYPWKNLLETEPGKRAFVIPANDEADAKQIKAAVYSHGVAYFTSRELDFLPLVRPFQKDDGSWHVAAFIKVRDGKD